MTNPQEQAEGVKPVEVEPGTLNEVLAVLAAIPVSEYPGKNWEARRNTAIRCLTAVGEALNRLTHQPGTAAQPVGDVERSIISDLIEAVRIADLMTFGKEWQAQMNFCKVLFWQRRKEILAALSQHPDPQALIGERCNLCGTSAPDAFARECNRPECSYRKPDPQPQADALEQAAIRLANFARANFADVRELRWPDMNEQERTYFRNAAAALQPLSDQAVVDAIVAWLRTAELQHLGVEFESAERLADAIARGDWKQAVLERGDELP